MWGGVRELCVRMKELYENEGAMCEDEGAV